MAHTLSADTEAKKLIRILRDSRKDESSEWLPKLKVIGRRLLKRVISAGYPSRRQEMPHEEQPPAAARAWRFAAKNASAGQRQIRAISVRRVQAGH
jgi:hypothetical protein